MASRQKSTRRTSRQGGNGTLHAWALQRCQRTYRSRNWAGKGTQPAIEHVAAPQAHWRPQPDQHNIAEIVLHMGYWKDRVSDALTGRKWRYRDADNWRTVDPTNEGWAAAQAEIAAAQRRLMEAIRALPPSRLMARAAGPWKLLDFIVDIATHDSYHSAQIFVLRRLYAGRGVQG